MHKLKIKNMRHGVCNGEKGAKIDGGLVGEHVVLMHHSFCQGRQWDWIYISQQSNRCSDVNTQPHTSSWKHRSGVKQVMWLYSLGRNACPPLHILSKDDFLGEGTLSLEEAKRTGQKSKCLKWKGDWTQMIGTEMSSFQRVHYCG